MLTQSVFNSASLLFTLYYLHHQTVDLTLQEIQKPDLAHAQFLVIVLLISITKAELFSPFRIFVKGSAVAIRGRGVTFFVHTFDTL